MLTATLLYDTIFQSTPSVRRATNMPARSARWEGVFQSTPSVRRATFPPLVFPPLNGISIHALREEGDNAEISQIVKISHFNPRPP